MMKRFLSLFMTLILVASFACAEGGKQVTVYPVAVAPELYTAFPGGEGTAFEGGFKTGFRSEEHTSELQSR